MNTSIKPINNLDSKTQAEQAKIDPSNVEQARLVHINEQWAIDECRKRDWLHSTMQGFGISIGKASINDASMLLLHHFINYKAYQLDNDSSFGLVEWLRQQTWDLVTNGELIGVNPEQNMLKIKHLSMYWVVGGLTENQFNNKSSIKMSGLTLLGVKARVDENIKFYHEQSHRISIHILNRLSTRALNVFIEKGLMYGKNICQYMSEALITGKVISDLGEGKVKLSYDGLNLIAVNSSTGRRLITVLS